MFLVRFFSCLYLGSLSSVFTHENCVGKWGEFHFIKTIVVCHSLGECLKRNILNWKPLFLTSRRFNEVEVNVCKRKKKKRL